MRNLFKIFVIECILVEYLLFTTYAYKHKYTNYVGVIIGVYTWFLKFVGIIGYEFIVIVV